MPGTARGEVDGDEVDARRAVEAERELRRRKEIKAHWEEKERRQGLGEESKAKLNERGNLEG